MLNPLWHLFALCTLAHLTNAGQCTRDQALQFKGQFLPNQHGLTISSMSNACLKIIEPVDSAPSNLAFVIWGTKTGTSDPVGVVAQVELECDTHNVVLPKKVIEACAIIGGNVAACQNGLLANNLEAELIKALKRSRSADNCPAHASTEIGKMAAEIEKKGRPRNIENTNLVTNWDLNRFTNMENRNKFVDSLLAVKAAGGTNDGKLLMVVEKVVETGYRYALALASKAAKWTVGPKDVAYFQDGKKIDSAKAETKFTEGVNPDKITAFLNN